MDLQLYKVDMLLENYRLLDLTSTRPTAASRSSIRTWTSLAAQVGEELMTQLLLLGKFEYTGGPILKVVLEC